MAAVPFKGTLDKPKVKEFTGQLDAGPSMGPSSMSPEQIRQSMQTEVAGQAKAIEKQTPWINRPDSGAQAAPFLFPAVATMAAGPAGTWGALGIQSLIAGAGGAGGEFAKEKLRREPIDTQNIATTGAKEAAGSFAMGAVVKGVGALAKSIFSSPMDAPTTAAAQFARDEGAPFPLSSAMPGSPASKVQQGTRIMLPGEIRTQMDANKVTQFLNNKVGTMTEKAQVFDDAAAKGQQFFAGIVNPNKAGTTEAWKGYMSAIGRDTPIPVDNTLRTAQLAHESLKNAGSVTAQKGDELYTLLDGFLTKGDAVRSPQELNLLSSAIVSKGMKGRTKDIADDLISAIEKDIVGFAEANGSAAGREFMSGVAARAQYRKLAKIPELERLAGELGAGGRGATKGTRDWMNTLFNKGNGKALAIVRKEAPDVYHDLADAWLAQQIDNASGYSASGIGRSVDGEKLRTWFVQNEGKIKEVFGAPQAKALDNFSLYASRMGGAVNRAAKAGDTFSPLNLATRAAAETAALYTNPVIAVPGEAASFVLARGLSDPSSSLFRVFTEGFSPATRSFMVKSGQIAGQAAGKESGED